MEFNMENFLEQQIVAISKASAYDALIPQIRELEKENKELKEDKEILVDIIVDCTSFLALTSALYPDTAPHIKKLVEKIDFNFSQIKPNE